MKFSSPAQRLLIEDVTQATRKIKIAMKGLDLGSLIKSIRLELGMSQSALARRARVPQSTVSRIEQEGKDANLSTLSKILGGGR